MDVIFHRVESYLFLSLLFFPPLTQQFLRLQNHQSCTVCIIDHGQLLEEILFLMLGEKINHIKNVKGSALVATPWGLDFLIVSVGTRMSK